MFFPVRVNSNLLRNIQWSVVYLNRHLSLYVDVVLGMISFRCGFKRNYACEKRLFYFLLFDAYTRTSTTKQRLYLKKPSPNRAFFKSIHVYTISLYIQYAIMNYDVLCRNIMTFCVPYTIRFARKKSFCSRDHMGFLRKILILAFLYKYWVDEIGK